jgi:hypothetical protein
MKTVRFCTLVILTLLTISLAAAQDTQPPLLIVPFGQEAIFQYQAGSVTALDACAPQGEARVTSELAVSPDGWRYAFLTAAPNARSAANNIRICDLDNQSLIPITGQPQTQVTHSTPAWSPDGTKLAFVRLFQDQDRMEFVIYDLATRNAKVVFQRTASVSSNSLPPQVIWGPLGASAFNTNVTDQTRPRVSEYWFYPAAFIAQNKPDDAVVGLLDSVYDSIQSVVTSDGAYSFTVSTYGQPDKLLDLATNAVTDLPGTLVKINPLATNGAFAQTLTMSSPVPEWIINGPDYSATLGIPAPTPDSLAIAPDGTQFAFVVYENYPYGGKVYIITDVPAFQASTGTGQLEGLTHLPEFDAHYGEPGALAVYWGPSIMKLNE